MRNKEFDKLLKEAIILDAEEQGARMEPSAEPIPEAAQARFDAALDGKRKESKRTIDNEPSVPPQPVKRAHRWLAYGLTAVSAVAVVLVVVLLLGSGFRRTKAPEAPAEQPPMQAETTMAPQSEPEPEPEPGEPLPYAHATFTDENAAIVAMMRFYEENRTLLMAVAADLKAPEHGEIENGVVYPIKDNGLADLDHPYASTTDSIKAFLDLPDSGDYVLFWDDSIFHVSLRWTNDSGYYSTNLVFAEDGQRIVKMMYEKQGVILEPVYEDSAWGVYTVCWRKAPYYHDSSYALGPETGVWETDDVPFLYMELFDDGTARILERFGDADTRAHYAWDMTSRNIVLLTFSDQTVVRTAELNTDTDAMTLTLADGNTVVATRAEGVVPDDPERPDLHLFTKEWQGYTCLFPETLAVYWASELELISEAGEFVDGLDELRYEKVAEDKIAGTDLMTWKAEDYIALADSPLGSGRKNADKLVEVRRTEIVPGVTCLHLYHPDNEYYLSYAVPDFDGTDALFLIGISFDASGMDDFDSIVRRFLAINPDHTPAEAEDLVGTWKLKGGSMAQAGAKAELRFYEDGTAVKGTAVKGTVSVG